MPITNLDSWIPTTQEFINHWTQVNTELGPGGPLLLLGAYAVATLTTDRTTLDGQMTAVVAADNVQTNARGDFDIKNAALVERLRQFRGACTAYLAGSSYAKSPPKVPPATSIGGKFISAYDDMANIWGQVNASPPPGFTPPLTLATGYTAATFNTDLAALRAAYIAYTNAVENASIAREARNLTMERIFARLKQYRGAAIAKLPPTSPLLATIPQLTAASGSTPDPVNLSGQWIASPAPGTGRLTWTASTHPDLLHYAIRYHPGPKYKAAEEQAVTTVAPGILTLDTLFGLAASGSVSWFKVYVVLTTGNERGSNAVKITRP